MFSYAALVALFTTALAAPTGLSLRDNGVSNVVPSSTCNPSRNVTLTAADGKGIFTIQNNNLTFDPSAEGQGLAVQFQACDPNFGGFTNSDKLSVGHVFIPAINQCLLVQDVSNPTPGVLTGPCETPDDSRQILLSWMLRDGQVFWTFPPIHKSGETKADGTKFQGAPACMSGIYGYQSDASGGPAAGAVTLACTSASGVSGFKLSQ